MAAVVLGCGMLLLDELRPSATRKMAIGMASYAVATLVLIRQALRELRP